MALFWKYKQAGGSGHGWLSGLLGGRAIEKRLDENFPTWEEYSNLSAKEEPSGRERIQLPPHRVYISSPLHGNFLYITLVILGLALGYYTPELAPVLVYGAIFSVLAICLFVVFRDGLFFHVEASRLELDGRMINRHTRGPSDEHEESGLGFLRSFTRNQEGKKYFRSHLLQIHYQNILRTFEQGNRRAWVDQDASIAEIQTLVSQRGMKLVWTMIEVLPQLGLLGTLIGLMRMFTAFQATTESPQLAILAGFGTALGTTVLANIFVLILRPLYMRNERSMHEILTTVQTLMATFILPTQQTVLERTRFHGFEGPSMASSPVALSAVEPHSPKPREDARVNHSLDELVVALQDFTKAQQSLDNGTMAKETASIAQEVQQTLKAFNKAMDRNHIEKQQQSIHSLTQAVEGLAGNLNHLDRVTRPDNGTSTGRIEHDLMQLRLLTHDTLVLLEQIAGQMGAGGRKGKRLLSMDQQTRKDAFPEEPPRAPAKGGAAKEQGRQPAPSGVRLFREPI